MTNVEQIAAHAINGMTAEEKAAFIAMFEAGQVEMAETLAKVGGLRSINRQITMANMAISNSQIMENLVEAVAAS